MGARWGRRGGGDSAGACLLRDRFSLVAAVIPVLGELAKPPDHQPEALLAHRVGERLRAN
eukprot:1183867-Prorocentrum_minimum.AAC.1